MSSVSTNQLDHIVHLTPPASVKETSEQFRKLGFNVLPGGTHEDGLTANALVILADDAYFELISFTKEASEYPPDSSERKARESHRWASQKPGWVDYGFLGNGSQTERISDIINARAGKPLYASEVHGGRKNADGQVLEWLITSAVEKSKIGVLPFYCGDITPRKLRVPTRPVSNTEHPNTVLGFAHVLVLSKEDNIAEVAQDITSVVGHDPKFEKSDKSDQYTWTIQTNSKLDCRLILSTPSDTEASSFLECREQPALYEIGFRVKEEQKQGTVMTPYARIVLIFKST